jgi:hypothetical protein
MADSAPPVPQDHHASLPTIQHDVVDKGSNVVDKRVRITSECATHQLFATRELPAFMAPPTQTQSASYEADIHLAISAL